jgi:hypothetical protein
LINKSLGRGEAVFEESVSACTVLVLSKENEHGATILKQVSTTPTPRWRPFEIKKIYLSVRHVTGTDQDYLGESPEWLFRYLLLL